ncbi:MAG: CBS domain-containing protein [Chloroflexi bacterium]|nr:CBS domain-containing protein [Chloroflexota bacterium]
MKLILTHDNADFDAVASLLAAYKLDSTAVPVLPHRVNQNVEHFLNLYRDELPFVQREDLRRKGSVELVTVVDTQSFSTARGMRPDTPIRFVDHHPLNRELTEYQTFSGDMVGAATTLLVEQIHADSLRLSGPEATLLMLGIYEDTGSLLYGTTTPRDIRCAAWLLECGANLDIVRRFLQHPLTPEQRELYDRLRQNAEIHPVNGHAIVLACASIGQTVDEIATLAHRVRELYESSAVFILVQLNGDIQLVARGTTDLIDVSVVAKRFGGGGHSRAAAALIHHRKLHEVRAEILEMLPHIVQASIRVESLMSMGVQTVQVHERVKTVVERMRRAGHEGYPVVDGGRVVGLLTNRAVERTMSHGMSHQTASEIMEAGEYTVKPSDSIEVLQQRMMRSGWGQIPVVNDEGILIGIVTRTDLIKRWGQRQDDTRREGIMRRMQASLPPGMWTLIQAVAQQAQERRIGLYVVGGFVRDLLLGLPTHDIDLVVEGDAIELVRLIHREYGGQMRSHAQFGTGKWMLDQTVLHALDLDPATAKLPEFIDFVTARSEFYEQPTALPTIQRGSIKLDLHRRDFTINTLALRLSPEPLGELIDFYGGEQDLRDQVIRVLHSLSFVDDPTRMLRAVRLEQRLEFTIEPRTEELIRNAISFLDRVSGDRIRHEIALIFSEEQPLRALIRLEQLGILQAFHPDLRIDEWVRAAFYAIRFAHQNHPWPSLDKFDNWMLSTFSLFTSRLPEPELEKLGRRLQFKRSYLDHLQDARVAIALLPELSQEQLPSTLVRMLEPLDEVGWLAAWAAAPSAIARDQISRFAREWRFVKPQIDGREVQRITDLKPGPIYGVLLEHLRRALLDGEITTLVEQKLRLRQMVHDPILLAQAESRNKSQADETIHPEKDE